MYDDLPERKNAVLIDFDIATNVDEATPQSDCTAISKEDSLKDADASESQHPAEKEQPSPTVQASITTITGSTNKSAIPERLAGAIAYMPYEVIKAPTEPVSRQYRHDFESFAWCLVWQCIKPHDRKWDLATYGRDFGNIERLRKYWRVGQHEFDRARWGLRMEFLVKSLLIFWCETVTLGRHWKKLMEGDESMKDPFAELASGPLFGDSSEYKVWENEEEERKWIVERFTAILRQAGLPLGFEFAYLDSQT
ncbi:hypothetical protein H1R20_g1832, partial [Candolleomyces eurysporus]